LLGTVNVGDVLVALNNKLLLEEDFEDVYAFTDILR